MSSPTSQERDVYPNEDGDVVDSHTPLLNSNTLSKKSLTASSKRLSLSFQDWFSWDLASAFTASLSMVAIVILLAIFDGSSLPDWPSIFTINSVVSFFSSISKLAFMSIAGTSISQSKWIWYHQSSRPLSDLELFDNASRGPWGAVSLIGTYGIRTLAALSSIAVILSLLFDPFLQQVVAYRDELVPLSKDASIVRAQRYLAPSYEGLALPSVVDLSMKAAIYGGTFDPSNRANTGTELHCSTGKCTFDSFSSLAVGTSCVDISENIERSCNKTGCFHFSLAGGPSISGSGGQINNSITTISSELAEVQASIVQFTSIYARNMTSADEAKAWECALYYCINEYEASIKDGNFLQSVRKTWRNDSASHTQQGDLIYNPPSSFINITADSSYFYVDNLAAKALNSFISDALIGSGGVRDPASGSQSFSSDIIHAFFEADNISERIDNLAVSMSNNIRQQNSSGSKPFQGTAWGSQTYVHVRWAWLAYPLTVLLISLLSLALTIFQTGRFKVNVWKSSTLALLFHGQQIQLSDDDNDMSANTLSQMTQVSSQLKVELVKSVDEKWNLLQT